MNPPFGHLQLGPLTDAQGVTRTVAITRAADSDRGEVDVLCYDADTFEEIDDGRRFNAEEIGDARLYAADLAARFDARVLDETL